jgi:hypothetical protein
MGVEERKENRYLTVSRLSPELHPWVTFVAYHYSRSEMDFPGHCCLLARLSF